MRFLIGVVVFYIVLQIFSISLSGYTKKEPKPIFKNHKFIIFAHRGASGEYPESTLPAFKYALEEGANALELDIHMTRDSVIVVFHDSDVSRTTDGEGQIEDLTLAELKKLDAGYWFTKDGETYPFRGKGLKILTLEEVFQKFPGVIINIEIKKSGRGIEKKLADLIRKYHRENLTIVSSFSHKAISRFRKEAPEVATGLSEREAFIFYILQKLALTGLYRPGGDALQVPIKFGKLTVVSPGFVKAAHRKGLVVHIWTVDRIEQMVKLVRMGVDGIFTDYPLRLRQVVERLKEERKIP